MPEYYKPSLSARIREEVLRTFERNERIKNLYSGSVVRFIEDAVRRLILYYENPQTQPLSGSFELRETPKETCQEFTEIRRRSE
ncbi:MAG: hypothetical protein ACFFCQ_03720 [Promethearchaeota archaeon]